MSTVSRASNATTAFHTALSRATDTYNDEQEDRLHTPDDYQAMLERAMMLQKPFDEIPYDRSASSSRLSTSRLEAHSQQYGEPSTSNSQLRQSNGWMGARNIQAPSPAPFDRNAAASSYSATTRPISPSHSISSVATSRGGVERASPRSYSGSVSASSSNYSTSARNGYPADSDEHEHEPSLHANGSSTRNGHHNSSASSAYSYSHQSTHAPRSLTSHDTSHNITYVAGEPGPANTLYRAEALAPIVVDTSGWESAFQLVSNQARGIVSPSDFEARLRSVSAAAVTRRMNAERPSSPSDASTSNDTSYEASSDAGTETGSTSTLSKTSTSAMGGKGIRAKNREILRNGSGREGRRSGRSSVLGSGDPEMDELIQSIKKMEMKRNMLENAPKPPGINGNAWRLKPESSSSASFPQSTASLFQSSKSQKQEQQPVVGHLVSPEYLRQPSEDYMAIARRSSQSLHISTLYNKRPKLLVLDLNNTLLARKRATSTGARNAHMRPFLSSFLEYICGADEVDGKLYRRFNVMVRKLIPPDITAFQLSNAMCGFRDQIWSSAQPDNVKAMVESMGLLKTVSGGQAPFLVDVWARDSMDLTEETYNAKFPTIKDLSKIWRAVTWKAPSPASANEPLDLLGDLNPPCSDPPIQHWSQYDTILIDDSAGKACLQPYNHLHIPSWKPFTPDNFRPMTSIKPGDDDNVLLQVIGMLDHLRLQSNISAAFRSGRYGGIGRTPVGQEWKRLGENVLERAGIQKSLSFDREWGERVLSGNDPSQALAAAQLYGTDLRNGAGRVGWN